MGRLPEITLRDGDKIAGFTVKAVRPVEEVRVVAYELEHERCGARILHLHANDPENLFSISFPTPPPDDTGVPHIIEHSVLSGSERFPVRDPFFEMIKMSMATFINAMTGADCTYYPVSSNVKKDLFNLADVYFDAVFHPLLVEDTLKKEGHHLVPADEGNPLGALKVNGIVYNEMKSAVSMPETLLYYRTSQLLFPDSIYGRHSGGDPEAIPDLTYTDFKHFYELAYHPSNAHFVLYGDIPTEEYLAFLADRLSRFERGAVPDPIALQPRWDRPRDAVETYPVAVDEETKEKTYIALEWIVGNASAPSERMAVSILSRILLGNEAAPLKKAIIKSQLGQDLIGSGYGTAGLELTFGVGIKGSEPDRGKAFQELVLDELGRLADGTFDPGLVEAAFQQAAYRSLEVGHMYPLDVMSRVLQSWIYGSDPLAFLSAGAHLDACHERYGKDPALFNRLIRALLLDNTHRLRFVLQPDPGMQARTDAAFEARMQKLRASMSDDQMRAVAEKAEELQHQAGTPNPPETLATLPQLSRRDLPPKPRHIPTAVEDLGNGVTLLCNDVFANGVNYLRIEFDLRALPAALWPCLPRFTDAVSKLGAAGMDYEEMARRTSANTGGVWASPSTSTRVTSAGDSVWGLVFGLKTLDAQIEPALSVLHDLLFALEPRDEARLHDVTVQALAHCRTHLVQRASQTAMLHAARGLSPEGHLGEQLNGLPQLPLLEEDVADYERQFDAIAGSIEAVRDHLLDSSGFIASFTGSDSALDVVRRALAQWGGKLRARPREPVGAGFVPFAAPPREGLAAPMQVAHCVQLVPAPHASHPDAPLLSLASALLRVDYMVHELRFKGNAYGAFCSYSDTAAHLMLGSYADPHIVRTLNVFAGMPDYIRQADWTEVVLDRAVISTAKNDNRPIRPESATGQALGDYVVGRTREWREERYERMLSATPEEVRRTILDVLDANLKQGPICVASSREKLEAANREMPDAPLSVENILGAE